MYAPSVHPQDSPTRSHRQPATLGSAVALAFLPAVVVALIVVPGLIVGAVLGFTAAHLLGRHVATGGSRSPGRSSGPAPADRPITR